MPGLPTCTCHSDEFMSTWSEARAGETPVEIERVYCKAGGRGAQ